MDAALKDAEGKPDTVRAAYDAWISRIDPLGTMDDYQRGRLWLRDDPCGLLSHLRPTPSEGEEA